MKKIVITETEEGSIEKAAKYISQYEGVKYVDLLEWGSKLLSNCSSKGYKWKDTDWTFFSGVRNIDGVLDLFDGEEIIKLSIPRDFKKLKNLIKPKELPKEYIVGCGTVDENNEVLSNYYHNFSYILDEISWLFRELPWTYIICTRDNQGTLCPKVGAIEDYISDKYSNLPIYAYDEWKELIKTPEELRDEKIKDILNLIKTNKKVKAQDIRTLEELGVDVYNGVKDYYSDLVGFSTSKEDSCNYYTREEVLGILRKLGYSVF